MGGEIKGLIKVCLSVLASLCYSYFIVSKIPKGKFRLLSLLPIFSLFVALPLFLSTAILSGITAFFITWLATFRLALFSFDLGPLSTGSPKSLLVFIAIACLPIKIKPNQQHPSRQEPHKPPRLPLNFAVKVLAFGVFIGFYQYKELVHPKIFLGLLCCQVFLFLEVLFSLCSALVRCTMGLEVEQPSDEPYLSTSLQDFWGRRWNLMVTNLLRHTVYKPVKSAAETVMSERWSPLPAVVATFLVSGLMHELLFYYVNRVSPSWEMTSFFVLHGVCLVVEVGVKSVFSGRWRLHWAASVPLTVGFVVATSFWLFFPPLIRAGADMRVMEEVKVLLEPMREKIPLLPLLNSTREQLLLFDLSGRHK
ncbi:hypothetical protein VitviT2T_029929 [Vitis vinifera]|uniref:Wax synthase domain-containing protein n=2 Tax=Vitis vinifera TaxID=29760 RepID=A0ABY9E172_VITVI|nr:probable long-chain-alcohol O-fatty-acyltransferase 5 [Vitis vinifera]RVW79904.1 putative long-chain-alcohol O-fatty-acyltransferase 5 [Vitis vinifera]WKA12554.1 hypothetical protein VitviT2T_029929 [Vitis vinifera]CAN61368.1 hypothetical protein VITISV_020588 [Vitis vinifera]|eukprot:XP_002276950.1 PREDICTED: probable long-chain-alcohol O-fatty-acyltransferase 5 [Vitis vinifera]